MKQRGATIKTRALRRQYDFIVCGAGPAGCVVASRLAVQSQASVLLIEAGPLTRTAVTDISSAWPLDVGSERDWQFTSEPESKLSDRVVGYSMGKLVGGGSSINASVWARGHKDDWDGVAAVAGDSAWGYGSILSIYRQIEDYTGVRNDHYHGRGGPLTVGPSLRPASMESSGLCGSFLDASAGIGIAVFPEQNGALQEAQTGASITDLAVEGPRRSSVIDGYVTPAMDKGNLDLMTDSLVIQICIRNGRAFGVQVVQNGQSSFIEAAHEIIVACGAIQTPKLLLQSGVGDRKILQDAGIACTVHLPGVGRNLQDHPLISLSWRTTACKSVSASAQAMAFVQCGSPSTAPDSYLIATEIPSPSDASDNVVSWAIGAALLTPESRGRVTVLDADPKRKPQIRANYLSVERDLDVLQKALKVAHEIGNSRTMEHLSTTCLNAPKGGSIGYEQYIRSKMRSGWHLAGTCMMGNDDQSVVDGSLRVHGVFGLRICDTSILPKFTRGNTMAPAMIIGERLAQILMRE